MTIPAFPLSWPPSWSRKKAHERRTAAFHKAGKQLTIGDGVKRVLAELERMGVADRDIIISSNIELRIDGYPRSNGGNPADPGVAVYWPARLKDQPPKCMAIDRYDRVADNLAAIAATLEAMRAIERHGGAEILERAFTGFTALDGPATAHWSSVLGVPRDASTTTARAAHRILRSQHHPDKGGEAEKFKAVNDAWDQCCREHGIQESE